MIRMIPMFGVARGVYTSVFLAVSAYCNAGFDVLGPIGPTGSLSVFSGDWLVLGVLGILIIIGGLGFIVFNDIFTSRLRGERQHRLMLHSKVVLMITGGLILLGTVGFLILEHNHLLAGKPFGSQVIDSWFSAVTPRTAGYAVVNYGSAQSLTKLLTCMLMFIGASPGGTGGGVKTSTVFVLLMTVYSVMVGYNDTVILRKRVERSTVYKAIALVFFSILLLSIAFIILVICEQGQHEIDLLFEVVSAFSTTGLSSANTASLGTVSKAVLIALMYIGRVGPISFILTLSTHYGTKDRDTTLPEGKIMVG